MNIAHAFFPVLGALTPVFLMIFLGYGLKRTAILNDQARRPLENFAVSVLYPGFLLPAVWQATLSSTETLVITAGCYASVLIPSLLLLLSKPFLPRFGIHLSNPTLSSVLQGLIRFNNFVFLPIIAAVYGEKMLGLAVIAVAGMVPLVNILSVLALARWGESPDLPPPKNMGELIRSVLFHPIIAACLLGLLLNLSGFKPPAFLLPSFTLLGQAAIPMGLILAGAGLSFGYMKKRAGLVAFICGYKMIIMPLIAGLVVMALGGGREAIIIASVCAATPTAAASYVLARQRGGDAEAMAGIIAATTVFSLISLPILLTLFHL